MTELSFPVKQTFIKEETIKSDYLHKSENTKQDLKQRLPADVMEDCIEDEADELCLTEDCVKAGGFSACAFCWFKKTTYRI